MVLLAVGLAFALPILWVVSVGAVREARRLRRVDPREGCQAWVTVPGLPGRRYRCAEPVYAGGPTCLRHEVAGPGPEPDEEASLIDQPQGVGRALVRARIGVPLAVATLSVLVVAVVWLVQRAL